MPLLISEEDVRAVMALPASTGELIDRMEAAFAAQAGGAFGDSTRVVVDHPPGSGGERAGRSLRVLPCVAPEFGGAAVRIYSTRKDGDPFRPAPCELLLLFDPETMELRSLIEDYSLHALRTAAPTGVATRHLARADATVLGVVGTGRQARGQVAAVASVRAIEEVRIHGRDPARREAFRREVGESLGCPVVPVDRAEDAVRGADVVVLATNTDRPVVAGALLEPGTHVNSIGPAELDEAAATTARLFPCSRREVLHGVPAWEPFPDLVARGVLGESALATELCDVVAGRAPGRTGDGDVTIFLSTGMPFWDLVAAAWVDERARALALGTPLPDGRPDTYLAPRATRPELPCRIH